MLHDTVCPNLTWRSFIIIITMVDVLTFVISLIGSSTESGGINP